ncbi:MAG: PaaI family thioesterase, partial [Desulfuromonadales bacterium]|nr:PaaI family thioesterase [Desulfuromonadales bacterium]
MYKDIFEEPMTGAGEIPFELPGWIACAPFEEYLGMNIEEAKDGRAVLTMPFLVKHSQGKGFMHGGAVTALADTTVAMAIKSILPEGTHFVTTDLSLKFHAPVTGGIVKAVASVKNIDERTFEGLAELFSGDIKVATFNSRFKIRRTDSK